MPSMVTALCINSYICELKGNERKISKSKYEPRGTQSAYLSAISLRTARFFILVRNRRWALYIYIYQRYIEQWKKMTFFFLIDLFILHDAVVNHWNVGKLQQQQQRRRKRLTTLKNLNRMTRECVEARSIAGETEHLIVWRDGKQISKNPTATKKKKNEDTIVSGARWIRRCLWAAVFFFFFLHVFRFRSHSIGRIRISLRIKCIPKNQQRDFIGCVSVCMLCGFDYRGTKRRQAPRATWLNKKIIIIKQGKKVTKRTSTREMSIVRAKNNIEL